MGVQKLLTIGEIARRLGCPVHKIEYLVASRNIAPIQRAGNLRIFSESDLQMLQEEVARQKNPVRIKEVL